MGRITEQAQRPSCADGLSVDWWAGFKACFVPTPRLVDLICSNFGTLRSNEKKNLASLFVSSQAVFYF